MIWKQVIGIMNKLFSITFMLMLTCANTFAQVDNHWKKCRNFFAEGTTIPFHGPRFLQAFKKKCAPDTLYSWQSFSADSYEKFKTHPFSGYSQLYTWRTPLGTFAYGSSQIRIKLKKDVQFKWIRQKDRDCKKYPASEKEKTVYTIVLTELGAGLSEYLLCSPSVVETWSKNSEGAKLESLKELDFVQKSISQSSKDEDGRPKKQKFDRYGGFSVWRTVYYGAFTDVNPYFPIVLDHGTDWSPKALQENLNRLGKDLDPEDGVIFPAGASEEIKSDHFRSRVKSYFHLSDDEIQALNL